MNLKMNYNGYFYFEMKLTTHTLETHHIIYNVCGNQKKNNFN